MEDIMLRLEDIRSDWQKRLQCYEPKVLTEALSAVKERSIIAELLESAYSDNTVLSAIAAKSYVHSNGFDKFVLLVSSEPEFRLRFHVWWPNSKGTSDTDIHNHKWDFRSRIIEGSYRHQEYIVDTSGEKWQYHICHSILQKKGHQMEHKGTKDLFCVSDSILVKECEYTLDHRVLHKVSLLDHSKITSTIVLQGPVMQSSTVVYSRKILDESLVQPGLCEVSEVRSKIRKYLDMLD
jgi:hypothetical protein